MKLYQENLQQKLDESEQARSELLESTKHMINVNCWFKESTTKYVVVLQ